MIDGLRHFYLCTQRYKVRYQSGLSCQQLWLVYVLSWRDWYNRISTHAVTSLIWCGTCKFATFQGFVIKWIHNPARNPVSGYKIKWESTKYRSKMAVGTYELSIENWTYGSDETYPKRVLQDFKKIPFFLKIAYFAPLNALRAHTAWSKKTTLLQRFLGHACLQHYTWVAPPGMQWPSWLGWRHDMIARLIIDEYWEISLAWMICRFNLTEFISCNSANRFFLKKKKKKSGAIVERGI